MQTRIAYVLFTLSLSILVCHGATAQEGRISPQLGQVFFLKSNQTPSEGIQANSPAKTSQKESKGESGQRIRFFFPDSTDSREKPLFTAPQTAHIVILQAPLNIDPGMILEMPHDFHSNMPLLRAIPPSSRDLRGMYVVPRSLPSIDDLLDHSPR